MSVVVFLGPTLPVSVAREILDADYRPPASQGDVLRATMDGAAAIVVIDGYFEHRPAVWHKEILHAMAEGVHVFGASSMGALRAAELADFGMEGVGKIFEQYRDGVLDADDEVAVSHGSAEDGYRMSSEALVNIRATLDAARAAGVVTAETSRELIARARSLFYPDRTWLAILAGQPIAGAMQAFLGSGRRVDQKRADALAVLDLVKARVAAGLSPLETRYHFEETDAWHYMVEHASEG